MPQPAINTNDPEVRKKIEEGQKQIETTLGSNEIKKLPALMLDNGAVYEGEWRNGMRQGYGVQNWPDGSRYEG